MPSPHSNELDPFYDGDVTAPGPVLINPLDAQYVDAVALSWLQPEEYVMILRSPQPINDDIIEQQSDYTVGDAISYAKVVYMGDGTQALDEEFDGDGGFYYRAFAFDHKRNFNLESEQVSTLVYVDAVYVHWDGNQSNIGTSGAPLAGIQAGIAKAGSLGLSEVHIAGDSTETEEYAVTSSVSMANGISIYGGYNPDDWASLPDPLTYPTIVERTGSDTGDMMTINANNLTGEETISGLRVSIVPTVSIQETSAILITNSDIRIEKCDLTGGDAPDNNVVSCGIKIVRASPTILDNYSINGGSSYNSYGIYIEGTAADPSDVQIIDNNYSSTCITGGAGTDASVGIKFTEYTSGTVSGNKIKGCTDASSAISCGIDLEDSSADIYENHIEGGAVVNNGTNYAFGLFANGCTAGVNIYNNFISVNDSNYSHGVQITDCDIYLRNNTIYCSSVENAAWIINIMSVTAADDIYIQNNIFQAGFSSMDSIGINEGIDVSAANSYLVQKNNFNGFTYVYNDSALPENWSSVDDMNTDVTGVNGNIDDVLTLNTTNGTVTNMNPHMLDFADLGVAGNLAGWGFTTDITGTERTDNGSLDWSMGAYEYDTP